MTSFVPAWAEVDAAALLWALPDPLIVIEADGRYLLNQSATARFGATLPPLEQLACAETWVHLRSAVTQARVSATTQQLSITLYDTQQSVLCTVAPAGAGRVLLHLRDSRHPVDVATELLDTLGLGVIIRNGQYQTLHANALGRELLQLTEVPQGGVPHEHHYVWQEGERLQSQDLPIVRVMATGQPVRGELMGVVNRHSALYGQARPDPDAADWRWIKVSALPIHAPTGQIKQVITVFEDVTDAQRLRRQLARSEARYRSLVKAMNQMVWITDAQGKLTQPQDWANFTGQTEAEAQGEGWLEAIHPEDRQRTRANWQRAVQQGGLYEIEHRVRCANGDYALMRGRGLPLRGEHSEVLEWVGVHEDMTALRQAERHLRDLNAGLETRVDERTRALSEVTRFSTLLLTAAGEGIYGLDARGHTTFVNPAAVHILGYPIERMLGLSQHELIHHHTAQGEVYPLHACPIHQTLQDGQSRRIEEDVFWHAQGHAVPVSYVVTPTHSATGEITGAVVMFQDITERQKAQSELQQAIENLRRSNQELEQFAYIASHDLQEPLRTLGSYAELLERRYKGKLDARADQYLGFMQEAVVRMRSLIQDLLAFSRLTRTEQAPELLSMDTLVAHAVGQLQMALQESGAQLTLNVPPGLRVTGHATLLERLLINLIGNALKFHKPGEPPQITVTAWAQGTHLRLDIADQGIGIAPEYHEKIFTIFQRLHHREQYAGNGMGLAICRKIVQTHGGTLDLSSQLGQGSTFHLSLPLSKEPHD